MKKNKKLLIGIGIVALIGIVAVGIYKNRQPKADDSVICIATVLPLTGEFGKEGELARKVFDFSAKAFNDKTQGKKIRLYHQDGKYAPKDSLMAFSKAVLEKPSAVIVYGDVPCNCLTKIASDGNIPVIAIAADNDIPYQSPLIFRGWVSTKLENSALADFVRCKLNDQKAAVLYLKNNFGEIARDNFKESYVARGGQIVAEESFDASESSLRSQIAKIMANKPEAIYVIGFGVSFATAINQIKETHYNGHILSNTIIAVPSVNKNIVNRGEGVYFIDTAFDSKTSDERVVRFCESFRANVGEDPTSFGAFEYEIIRLLGEVGVEFGDEPKQIQNGLYSLHRIDTLMGEFSYNKDGDVEMKLVPKQMRSDGTFKAVE